MKNLDLNLGEVEKLTHILMEELDCARALTVSLLVKYREWDQIATLTTVPSHYSDSRSYFEAVQATDFIRKLEELPTTIDKDAATPKSGWSQRGSASKLINVWLNSWIYPYGRPRTLCRLRMSFSRHESSSEDG